jgi:hypothetical protein
MDEDDEDDWTDYEGHPDGYYRKGDSNLVGDGVLHATLKS